MLKLAYKYFGYRYRQHRRKTSEKVVVETVYGPVRGVKRISCWDDSYYSFEKIPFAKPPVGELRFTDPQPPKPWTNARNCSREAAGPLQLNYIFHIFDGQEDCLYVNVYTKNVQPNAPRPVMVWIYGGGFENGAATTLIYNPEYLLSKDVVVVTFNYRVGVLGFLSLKDPKLKTPGNAGLKDQVMALKWVKENIAKFGGDPENVTIFGESAGGASVHFLMMTERTKGLFHKAILMSGTALCPWSTVPDHDWARRLANEMGYSGNNNEANILSFLKKARGRAICRANSRLLNAEEKQNMIFFPHGPVIEPYISDQCIISKDPRLMAREGWGNEIPILLGGSSFEGLLLHSIIKKDPRILKKLNDCEYLVPLELGLDRNSAKCNELGLRLKKEYFGDKKPAMFSFLNLMSYKFFWHGIHRTVQSRMKYASAPTYLYRFDFDSEHYNHYRTIFCGKGVRGVCHCDILTYVFHNLFGTAQPGTKEFTTIQRMIGIWSEFAYKSDPNFAGIEPIVWKLIGKDENPIRCVNIAENVEVIELPEINGIKVWDSLYPEGMLI